MHSRHPRWFPSPSHVFFNFDVLRPEAEAVLQVSKLLTAMDVPEPAMWSDLRSIARKCAEIFECDDQRLLHESFPMMQQYNELGAPKREVAFELSLLACFFLDRLRNAKHSEALHSGGRLKFQRESGPETPSARLESQASGAYRRSSAPSFVFIFSA